jgi:hypothetical protein
VSEVKMGVLVRPTSPSVRCPLQAKAFWKTIDLLSKSIYLPNETIDLVSKTIFYQAKL